MANIRKLRDSLGMNPNMNEEREDLSLTPPPSPPLSSALNGSEEVVEDSGDEASPSLTPPPGGASTLAVRDRTPMTKKIMGVMQDVQKMKFGRTPEERAAGLKKQMDLIQSESSAYQKSELNRKDENGVSIMDQISGAKRKLEDLESERHGTLQANQWGQIAEQLGNAITQTFAGMYGLKHNVNLSGLTFNRANWEERLKILLGDVNEQMDRAVKEQVQGQQLAQQVGETAYKTAAEQKQAALAADSKEGIASEKERSDMQSALISGAVKEEEIASREKEGVKNRASSLSQATTLKGMEIGAKEREAWNKENQERANVGMAPLPFTGSAPASPSAAPTPSSPVPQQSGTGAPAPQAPQAPLQQQIQQTPQTQGGTQPTSPADPAAAPASPEQLGVYNTQPLTLKMADGTTKTLTPLLAPLSSMPGTKMERESYMKVRGAKRAEYDGVGGDAKINESIRDLDLIVEELTHPSNANLTGLTRDRIAGVTKPLDIFGSKIGEVGVKASEYGRDRMKALKARLKGAILPGLKAMFGGQNISNAERDALAETIWESDLPPKEIADKVRIYRRSVVGNRNMMTMNPEANAKFDQETIEETKKFRNKMTVDSRKTHGTRAEGQAAKALDYPTPLRSLRKILEE